MLFLGAITSLVIIGIVLARRAPLGFGFGGSLFGCLAGVTVVGASLGRWRWSFRTNDADPTPAFLPAPMGSVLGTLGVLLVSAGPVIAGALLMLAYREGRQGSVALALLYVGGLWYVVHWAPFVIWSALT